MDEHPFAVPTADPTACGRLYTTSQVAQLIGVSQKTVQLWIRVGTLTAVRYGRVLRIRQEDLASFGEVVNQRPAALVQLALMVYAAWRQGPWQG